MDRETFARRLREATEMCRTLAMTYLKEDLPRAYRYRVRLNSSYDGNPLDPDEVVFPGDHAPERWRPLRACDADDVVAALWREGRIPEWIDLAVVAMTPAVSVVELVCCGRFTANEALLMHAQHSVAPFQPTGISPARPSEGDRWSIYGNANAATHDELEALRAHTDAISELTLEGPVADDEALLGLPDLPHLMALTLRDSNLRGLELAALEHRCPRLRQLYLYGVADGFDARNGPTLPKLTTLNVAGALARPCGLAAWADRLPALADLRLWAAGDLRVDDALPARIDKLALKGERIVGRARFPQRLDTLNMQLSQQDPAALEALLAPIERVRSLDLSGTPVGDDLIAKLVARLTRV
ncbi:MAG TPA: hypothetical protein VN903_12900 [Polyangia bacterium]|nr:hypothetical protein [Polyangia bacterium]